MTLQYFNDNFIYTPDNGKGWMVLKPNKYGIYRGDCEDYALTLKYRVDGFRKLKLWFCTLNGEGHIVGNLNGKWIDNNTRKLVDNLPSDYVLLYKVKPWRIWLYIARDWIKRKIYGS